MPLLKQAASFFKNLFRRDRVEHELDAEVGSYVDLLTEEKVRDGMAPAEARRAARIELGGVEQVKEEVREVRMGAWFETLLQDLRYGVRMLGRNPGFTTVAILTLALGIGANTAIFSLTDQVLLRMLPIQRPEELVILRAPGPNPGRTDSDSDGATSFSYPQYRDLRDRNPVFTGLLARYVIPVNLSGQGGTERAIGELVSGNYFEVLGVGPAIGRVFSAQDETAAAANPVTVLSYGYWSRHFGKDSGVLNKPLIVNGTSLTVVGVARAGFSGVQVGQTPDLFIPITMKAAMTPNWDGLEDRKDHWMAILGRLKPGLSRVNAEAWIQPVFRSILEYEAPLNHMGGENQKRFLARRILLDPGGHGRTTLQKQVQEPLVFLLAMVGVVLIIACTNLAGLLVARGEARQREIAVRLAMGAGRGRLVRQLMTESVLLALLGGCAGLALGVWSLGAWIAALPHSFGSFAPQSPLDLRVLGFAFALSLLTGILFGLAPALRATHADVQSTLKDQGTSAPGARSSVRLRKWLIVSQVALTAVLLTGAGLFAQSLINLRHLDLGVRTDHVIEFSIAPEMNRYTPAQTIAFFDRVRGALAALPGVRSVSAAEIPVLNGDNAESNITVEGYTPQNDEDIQTGENQVGPNYFATMGTPLLAGRELGEQDSAGSSKVAVVNEVMARQYFAGRNPIGLRFCFGAGDKVHPDIEIVGVAQDSKHSSLREHTQPFVYLPYAQDKLAGRITFYVRTAQAPALLSTSVRKTIQSLDPKLPLYDLKTLAEQVDESVFNDRLLTFFSLCLAVLASLLAALGLYGVMAYVVARRTREIGIRMALGETRGGAAWLILREVTLLTAVGLAIGFSAAFGLGRLIESQLFGVKANAPLVFLLAGLLLAGVAILAGFLPARRAAGVNPMVALRYE